MNIRALLIVAAKNAVNAILTNMGLMAMFSNTFNWHSWAGVLAMAKATGLVVLAREVVVWVPKLLKWSDTAQSAQSVQSASLAAKVDNRAKF